MKEFVYRSQRPALGHFPGHHRSRLGDSGHEFRSHAALQDAPDARRLDLLASLRDPMGQWLVRLASERKAIPVYAVADLSASMGYVGARRRMDDLADFTEALAWSAWRTGDAFGFVGCEQTVRHDWFMPLVRARGAGVGLGRRLRAHQPEGRHAGGLLDAHRMLRRQRSLVFLLSDFHLPIEQLDRLMDSLSQHEVVPVLFWDPAELEPPPARSGLASLTDAETGHRRLLWLRPALRERWSEQIAARQAALEALFRGHRLRPLKLVDGFKADAVTAYFHR